MTAKAMSLKEYVIETMSLLKNSTKATEILVERAKPMRFAELGDYQALLQHNDG